MLGSPAVRLTVSSRSLASWVPEWTRGRGMLLTALVASVLPCAVATGRSQYIGTARDASAEAAASPLSARPWLSKVARSGLSSGTAVSHAFRKTRRRAPATDCAALLA